MDRFRFLTAKLALGVLALGGWANAQERPPERPPEAPPVKATESKVEQASLVSRPKVRLATTNVGGLPAVGGSITASVIARVNGQPILVEEVLSASAGKLAEARKQVSEAQWPAAQAEILDAELKAMIDRELLLQDAATRIRGKGMDMLKEAATKEFDKILRKRKEQLRLRSDVELAAEMAKQGLSLEEERRQYERGFIAMEYVRNLVRNKLDLIDREQLLEYYRQNPKEFDKPERLVWQWLFVDFDNFSNPDPMNEGKFITDVVAAKRYAETVHGELQRASTKEQFEALVDKYAHSRSKTNRGVGEGQARGEIRPVELEKVLFTLKPGQVGPIVETPKGLHVVRVVEHTPGGKVGFEEACADVKRRLQSKLGMEEYNRLLKELRAKAHIESAVAK